METRVKKLSEGIAEAFEILDAMNKRIGKGNLVVDHKVYTTFDYLNKMNIRGNQIVVAYKSWANSSFDKLVEGIFNQTPSLVKTINDSMPAEYPFSAWPMKDAP